MRSRNLEFDELMNHAIEYLSMALSATGHNDKPVLLHSIRVGFHLYHLGYSEEIVLAGLLSKISAAFTIKASLPYMTHLLNISLNCSVLSLIKELNDVAHTI